MRLLALTVMMIPVILSGCTGWHGSYACKGYPEGVRCKSVRDVYNMTNYKEALDGSEKDEVGNNPGGNPYNIEQVSAEGAPVRGMGYVGPMPLRTQARIIRIWVAPWESQDGRLHLPNYIYAEVEKRQWSIGEGKLKVAPRITPLEPVAPSDKNQVQRQAAPARQGKRQVSQNKGSEKPLFPQQIQRPPVQNQEEMRRLQEQLTGQPQTRQGGTSGKEMY